MPASVSTSPRPAGAAPASYGPYPEPVRRSRDPAQPYPRAPRQHPAGPRYPGGPEPYPQGSQPASAGPPGAATGLTERASITSQRIAQFLIDELLVTILPVGVWAAFHQGTADLQVLGTVIAIVVGLPLFYWYWVLWPYGHDGQTFGMRVFGLKVLSNDGTQASKTQLLIRAVLLVIDIALCDGLPGLIAMLASGGRQRIGDHAAKTFVAARDKAAP